MRAFVNTEVTKDRLLASLEAHYEADRIVQGSYWNKQGRGCAVGCTLHDFRPGLEGHHALYEPLFGVPTTIAHFEDQIHEGLPAALAREWPLRFVRAIPEGADLSRVAPAVLYRIVERHRTSLGVPAVDRLLSILATWRDTGSVDADAAAMAWAAADLCWAQATSWRAASAAWGVADPMSYAYDSARSAEYEWIADVLIEEIQEAPIEEKEQ